VVFGDQTLRGLARFRPRSLDEMREIKGVGEKKLVDFGETFLAAIAAHGDA
jgi:ATP-dependent DNA helicase RecQ